jgi:HEPN domain-containing protein
LTNPDLARSYLAKAQLRLEALAFLLERRGYSDVVREAQELVELALKAALRSVGVEPPKYHDVGGLLLEHAARFPEGARERLPRAAEISKSLRRERELAFYGDIDFIPTEEYTEAHGMVAYEGAAFVVRLAEAVMSQFPDSRP